MTCRKSILTAMLATILVSVFMAGCSRDTPPTDEQQSANLELPRKLLPEVEPLAPSGDAVAPATPAAPPTDAPAAPATPPADAPADPATPPADASMTPADAPAAPAAPPADAPAAPAAPPADAPAAPAAPPADAPAAPAAPAT